MGFMVAYTPGTEGEHARVLLDRVYVELSPADAVAGRAWFVRPDDVHAAARLLRERGIDASDPATYAGRDGTWLDVELRLPLLAPVLPIVTRRSDAVMGGWPPALQQPHPNGVRGIAWLALRTPVPDRLGRVLVALGAVAAGPLRWTLEGGAEVRAVHAAGGAEGLQAIGFDTGGGATVDLVLSAS
jgi:hypothetical protein